jgi:excisionase family DNA binding protein
VFTVKEAAERLGVSAALVYALCAAKKLRHSRVGLGRGKIVIGEDAIAEYLRGRERGPGEQALPKPRR